MVEWLETHQTLLIGMGVGSVLVFVVSIIAAPVVIVRLPADYFAHDERPVGWADRHPPMVRLIWLAFKNALAVVLLLGGLAMLVLPGQGLLTILVAFLLVDVPGKYRLEQAIVRRPRVLRAINWLRRRAGRQPMVVRDEPQR